MPSSRFSIFRSGAIFTAVIGSIIITFVLLSQLVLPQTTTWLSTITLFLQPVPAKTMDYYQVYSCPQSSPHSVSKRTAFGSLGCTIFGYPSSGGILIKDAEIVDLQFLSLDRFHPSQRSSNIVEEDRFCALMRRVGATWWATEQEFIDVEIGMRENRIGKESVGIWVANQWSGSLSVAVWGSEGGPERFWENRGWR